MPNYDWECNNGHTFEKITPYDQDLTNCPDCDSMAERVWLSPRSPHRQLQVPIVLWQYADGTIGVAGGQDSKTPPNAERVEVRYLGDYRRYARQINKQFKDKDDRREERFQEAREAMEKHMRSNLAYMMGQENDPVARDIYRAALESGKNRPGAAGYREFFSVVAEMDRSNYE